ncbi:capsule biosynthesis protein CapA [Campylobacter upsaliensis]|uniref:capsule biosynthesis protein CapA n=1 Tax=Campylobacter upsaliensis TaxID=28080 RepID=UPI002B3B6623|nr:capsule biosynthesis protein CapA [Campylobacter upsaliensis]MEB2804384.1 capsule biosynthesis protein CapA [Campylobacter upsaliensis]MEB2812554.1 capsule biosynthesis protein CapA [Campylobacter upsaliensis]MEB2823596.1 capsule biosynthesis protein CapA [Campylobacter upsaliensis]
MTNKPLILGGRDDGFGERMRAILNAMYVAKKFDLEFGFVWRDIDGENFLDGKVKSPLKALPCMHELFSDKFISRCFRADLTYSYLTPILNTHHKKSITNLLKPPYERDWGWYMTQGDLDTWFNDVDHLEYRKSIASCFKSIEFSDAVNAIFKKVNLKTKDLGDFVALHIRSGETVYDELYINMWWHCRYKISPYPINIAVALEELKKGNNVVLFSDDFTLLESVKKYIVNNNPSFKSKIFIATELKENGLQDFEDMIFDVYLMSKAEKIYCSWTTGFARLACYIGNNKIISLPEHYSVSKTYELMIKFIDIDDINPHQAAFSYFFLYILAKELNLPFDMKLSYLKRSFELHQNYNTKIFLLDLLLEHHQFEEVDLMIEQMNLEEKKSCLTLMLNYNLNPTLPFHIFKNYFVGASYKNISRFAFEIFLAFNDEGHGVNAYYPGFRSLILDLFYSVFSNSKCLQNTQIKPNIDVYKRHSLAYTLGYAMIENSKSLWGYIRMPYVLSYLKEQHIKETDLLKKEKRYYEFYNEAHTLSVELGKALMKAHKIWYKGGYLRLIFVDIPIIKKEFLKGKK